MKTKAASFQEQLKVLQHDILTLSSKLSLPGPGGVGGAISAPADVYLNQAERYRSPSERADASSDEGTRKVVARLKREVTNAQRERDDALQRLDQAHREMDEMRRALQEAARLRASFDHLRQDHEALRISLESSERIRKQQKALIDLLQKSSITMSDAASVGSYSSSQYGGGGGSRGGGSVSTTNSRAGSYSISSQAAENKEWLNASPARRLVGSSSGAGDFNGGIAARAGKGRRHNVGEALLPPPSVASTPSRSIAKKRVQSQPIRRQHQSSERLSQGGASTPNSAARRPASAPAPSPSPAPAASPSPSPRPMSGRPPRPTAASPGVLMRGGGVALRRTQR